MVKGWVGFYEESKFEAQWGYNAYINSWTKKKFSGSNKRTSSLYCQLVLARNMLRY